MNSPPLAQVLGGVSNASTPGPGSGAVAMEEQGPSELTYAEGVSKRNELKHREGAFYEPGEACAKRMAWFRLDRSEWHEVKVDGRNCQARYLGAGC